MSNFLQAAKIILARRIKQIRNDSVSADAGLTNRAITFFSLGLLGRDKALSATKQDLDDDLLSELNNVQDGESDEATLETLKVLISKYKNSAKMASSKKGYDEGTSGPALQAVMTLLDDIYKKLEDAEKEGVKLLDTPDDDMPLNVYRYQTIRYLAQKVEDAGNQSLINKLLQNPKISSCHELAEEKEKLLIANLKQCEENIRELDDFEEIARREAERAKKAMEEAKKAKEERHDEDIDEVENPKPNKILVEKKPVDYPALRKKSVLSSLKTLKEENEALCIRFGPKISLPVSLAFFTSLNIALPTFKPGPGYLQECAEAAVTGINPPEVAHVSSCAL